MAVASFIWSCKNEDVRVTYPASTPSIDTANVKETLITYGDTIRLRVALSDKVAPLSTAKVKIVVNNEVVISETVRTFGNSFAFDRKYKIPFAPRRSDNADVKVYLTSTNVEGYSKDTIFSTTKAKRPVLPEMWYFADGAKGAKMTLTDPVNYIYKLTGQMFGTTISFKIGSKAKTVFGFKRLDWTGIVFGKGTSGFDLVDSVAGQSMSVTDATLTGISDVTFDAYNFTVSVGGKKLEPVTTLDITADLVANPITLNTSTNFRGGNVYFGEGVEVTFTGVTNLANNISPDYFEVTGPNTAKFLGKTGSYKAYFYTPTGYLYIDPQPEMLYPDMLWVCGTGYGRPQSPYATTSSWNWNSPLDYYPCRLVSPGVYQVTMYCKNSPNESPTGKYGKLDFKFFHKRGWWDGHEMWASDLTSVQAPFLGPKETNGNVNVLSADVVEGVFRFTVDLNKKTLTYVKLN